MNANPTHRIIRAHGTGFALSDAAKQLFKLAEHVMASNSPASSVQVDLAKAEDELHELGDLESDWDGEGAEAVDRQTINIARGMLRAVARKAERTGHAWHRPEVAPMRSGGVSLSWHLPNSIHWVILEPGADHVVYIQTENQRRPLRLHLPQEVAAHMIFSALSNQ